MVQGRQACGGIVSDHEDVRSGKVLAVAKHPADRMDYWLKVGYRDSKTALVHMLMSCGAFVAAMIQLLCFLDPSCFSRKDLFSPDVAIAAAQCHFTKDGLPTSCCWMSEVTWQRANTGDLAEAAPLGYSSCSTFPWEHGN